MDGGEENSWRRGITAYDSNPAIAGEYMKLSNLIIIVNHRDEMRFRSRVSECF